MNNQENKESTNTTIVSKEKRISPRENARNTLNEKYCDQFMGMALDTGHYALHAIKENSGDYKSISEDKNTPPVARALGKRKVLAADIGIGIGTTGGLLGLIWLAKKVFAA